MDGLERERLRQRYRELVLDELPRRARAGRWVVTADHCFGRIVLDTAVGGCWYDVLGRGGRGRTPAYLRLDDERLAAAVAIAEQIAARGDPLLRDLDARSLAWRGKPPKQPAGWEPAAREPAAGEPAQGEAGRLLR